MAVERWPEQCDTVLLFLRQAVWARIAAPEIEASALRAALCVLHRLDLSLTQHAQVIIDHRETANLISAGVVEVMGDHWPNAHEAALSIAQRLIFDAWRLLDSERLSNALMRALKPICEKWLAVFENVVDATKLEMLVAAESRWASYADASRLTSFVQLERAKLETIIENKSPNAWIKLVDAEVISGINRGNISRAADRGEIADNKLTGRDRRIDRVDFSRWQEQQAKKQDRVETAKEVERKLKRATKH